MRDFIQLRDPDHRISFPSSTRPPERNLTGGDFDIDPFADRRRAFWFGDEFGPFLLHTDSQGRLLEALPAPGVKSPQNPTLRSV